jgi:hypothetical protein
MKAWITRDKDGELWLHTHKPKRVSYPGGVEYWESSMNPNSNEMEILDKRLFKDLKWEDGPVRVEIKVV